MPKFAVTPNAVPVKSRTSSSGRLTAFSMRRKRAGRCAAVVTAGLASAAMPAGAMSAPSKS